ncbi:MAG: radical SAM protein [Candidatus Aenigmatarchaeota archaeon]
MKIALVSPKLMVWTGSVPLPLNLAYLASAVQQDGHEVKCLDLRIEPGMNVKEQIKDCDIVGISSCTPSIKEAWKVAEIAKGCGKTVILGGPHPTAMPDESLGKDCVDIVVRNEGEETLREICKGVSLSKISGISFRKDGKIVNNPTRPYIEDLDSLPFPARKLFDLTRYHSSFHKKKIMGDIMTSRGCPYNCNFCFKAIFGRDYRMRSARNVVAEWKEMIGMGIEEIGIVDDNFNIDKKRTIDICSMIIEQNLKVEWGCTGGIRVDTASKESFDAMRKAGCYRVAFGVESGDQDILNKVVCKGITLDQVRSAVKLAKEAGFETTLFFVMGNITETEKTMQKTIDFAKELDPDFVQFTIATPYPGSQLYETVKKEGKLFVDDWEDFGSYTGKAYFEHGDLKRELVERMYKKAYRSYYLRPRIMLKHVMKGRLDTLKGLRFLK